MSKIKTFKKLWTRDKHMILVAAYNNAVRAGITNFLSDETFLKLTYRIRFGEKLDLNNPITFDQKIQWLKLHDRQERYVELVDKVKVKDHMAKEIGSQYLIPTLGVWSRFEDIDFDLLPSQFVLKCNHDSGNVVVCRDKTKFDVKAARKKLTKSLNNDTYYYWGREWPYKNIERKILAEVYMETDHSEELKDYKRKIFEGKENCFFTGAEKNSEDGHEIVFYNTDWKEMPFARFCRINRSEIKNPLKQDEMVRLVEGLAKDIFFTRIDFYKVDGETYFGEAILDSGFRLEWLTPSEWDKTLGSWIKLPVGGALLIKENVVIHIPVQQSQDLTDYKFYCFGGEPKYCQVITGRTKDEKIDFYDMDWSLQPFVGLTALVDNSGYQFPKPYNFEKMKELASKLSSGTPFSRIDFYEVNEKLYFGEFTLYPASGFGKFRPDEWNKKLGDMITLNRKEGSAYDSKNADCGRSCAH